MKLPKKLNFKIELNVDCELKANYDQQKKTKSIDVELDKEKIDKFIQATKEYFGKLDMFTCNAEISSDNGFFREYANEFARKK